MINFGQYQTFGQSQELIRMLQHETPSLTDLLKRDEFLNDLKAGAMNEFINYLLKNKDLIEELITILTSTNTPSNFPFVVSEIFENSNLLEHMFAGRQPKNTRIEKKTTLEQYLLGGSEFIENLEENEESQSSVKFLPETSDLSDQEAFFLIQKIFSFLKQSNINETQMGYFGKVLNLIAKNYCLEFWNFQKICGSIITDLLSHLKFRQIQEFFARIIILDHQTKKNFNHNYKQRKELVQGLLECVTEWEESISFLDSVSEFLNCIFLYGNHLYEHINEIFDLIIRPSLYLDVALKSQEISVYKLYYNSICLLGVLNTKYSIQQQPNQYQQYFQIDYLNTQISTFINQIPKFTKFLNKNEIDQKEYQNYQILFGQKNLIIIKSIDVILRWQNQDIINCFYEQKIFDILLHQLIQFHMNNQLNITILSIFNFLIQQDIKKVIQETQIQLYINKCIIDSKNKWLGCIGTIKQIGYKLIEYLEQNLIDKLQEQKQYEEQYLLNIDPKDCKEIPPIELSIDRQIEMILDKQNQVKQRKE